MFTGLIQTVGEVAEVARAGDDFRLRIASDLGSEGDLELGESIAVNGVCLTVTTFDDSTFSAQASPETLSKSNLGHLRRGSEVNLERALRLGDRLGGHLVLGHVDGVGTLAAKRSEGNAVVVEVEVSAELLPYLVEKGSITMDGISLTVNTLSERGFTVAIVPWTSKKVALLDRPAGWAINLEVDILGKYVARLLRAGLPTVYGDAGKASGVSLELLEKHGFLS